MSYDVKNELISWTIKNIDERSINLGNYDENDEKSTSLITNTNYTNCFIARHEYELVTNTNYMRITEYELSSSHV